MNLWQIAGEIASMSLFLLNDGDEAASQERGRSIHLRLQSLSVALKGNRKEGTPMTRRECQYLFQRVLEEILAFHTGEMHEQE